MINTAKAKNREIVEAMKQSHRLLQLFNEDQLQCLTDITKEERWDFRSQIEGGQLEGKIYVVLSGQVSSFT
jgi:hypothetical protein